MKTKFVTLTLCIVILAGLVYTFRDSIRGGRRPAKEKRALGVHPNGAEAMGPATAARGEKRILYYQDPMHPWNRFDRPGIAPDCGMKLVPVYADEQPEEASRNGVLHLSADRQQLMGIQTAPVEERQMEKTIRAVARLNYDETKITHIHTKVEGWIQQVFVNYTGQLVHKGQPLFTLYSPDLVATQEEYLLALKGRQTLGTSPIEGISAGSESLLRAARRRLALWDWSDDQIKALEESGKPQKDITVYSTVAGFVVDRKAYENVRITPDLDLYAIADLSTIWAEADVFEYEASMIGVGQRARMTISAFPGSVIIGTVSYIYPQLNADTRTLRVRLDLENHNLLFKPGMYSNVEIKVSLGRNLVVPQDAVLDSGARQRVFLTRGNGYFEPRQVEVGDRADDFVVITRGLRRGDRVVTRANFLLDSESNLREALSGMAGMPGMQP